MNTSKVLKIMTQSKCPHCQGDIVISQSTVTPMVDWVLRPEDVAKAKEKVIAAVKEMTFSSEEKKENILEWLNLPETLFGNEEVETILTQLAEDK